ncbi:hypothetical protein GGS23DRAFT_613784 [Durotheca rogersii]|uniref:uncharacterized protein n=1 Tax=Durotheca rogersii TaxID=419775 RepID=UPI0022202AA0|nr:uncharacterized protein GGS23DRAFT_613784 [Durotheca rogersii]KAI5860538.1 hypothetical protein GGS23DRAFT_613784 [Durotheca rogersii]
MASLPGGRHALAPVDANTRTAARSPDPQAKASRPPVVALTSPAKRLLDHGPTAPRGRTPEQPPQGHEQHSSPKRRRLSRDATDAEPARAPTRDPSRSPDESSPSPSPAAASSQSTTVTAPDAEAAPPTPTPAPIPVPVLAPPPRPQPTMTRADARRNAETLRLRLGLASYKLRTGQADVPLERLEARSLADLARSSLRASRALAPRGEGGGGGRR